MATILSQNTGLAPRLKLTVFSINDADAECSVGAIRQMRFTLHSVACQQQ